MGTILQPLAPQDFNDFRSAVTGFSDIMSERVKNEYEQLFIVPTTNYVPPFESCFVDKTDNARNYGELWGQPASEMQALIDVADLEITTDSSMPSDHIGIELSFMAALCGEEATARGRNDISTIERMRELQGSLLSKHLLAWIGAFRRRIERSPVSLVYKYLARITEIFLITDNEWLRSSSSHQEPRASG
jgi:TorA maturation chaperone TorD